MTIHTMTRFFMMTFVMFMLFACAEQSSVKHEGKQYFVTLSDIHFDPFVACYHAQEKPCALIRELQHAPVSQWEALLEVKDNTRPAYRLDTNFPLLQSSLKSAAMVAQEDKARFVLVLGDFLGHDYRKYYKKYSGDSSREGFQSFASKSMAFLTRSLKEAFPHTDVIPVVGNNDTYTRDYQNEPNGAFFKETARQWAELLQDEGSRQAMTSTFPYAGYYSVTLPAQPGLRLIVLNSVLFSYKTKGATSASAADAQIRWLTEQLALARKNHQKVMIAMHIPMGIDVYATLRTRLFTLIEFWRPVYADQFKTALKDYASTVVGVFSGHLHSDWFQVLSLDDDHDIAVTGTPAISPIFGNNPGFKVYRYAADSDEIEDYYTYYLPLFENSKWGKEYEFDRTYQPNCQHCSILDGMKYLRRSGELSRRYQHYYAVSSDTQPNMAKWNPFYWCGIHFNNVDAYRACVAPSMASR